MARTGKLHLCALGCGWAAGQHARALEKYRSRVDLSFASRTADKAERFRGRYQGKRAFGSYDEAIACADIDAVLICTPHDQHHAQACQALRAGKHAVVEKPIAVSVVQAREMNRAAHDAGRYLLVAENFRFRPGILALETMIASGAIGAPKMIRIQAFLTRGMRPGEWRSDEKTMGGGPFIDGGIHLVNMLLTLGGGSAENIFGRSGRVTTRHCPREDTTVVLCDLANGAIGSVGYSWGIAGVPDLSVYSVHGTEGSIYALSNGFGALTLGKHRRVRLFPRQDRDGYHAMWGSFLATLTDGVPGIMTGVEGERDLAFVEAAYASAALARAPGLNSPELV